MLLVDYYVLGRSQLQNKTFNQEHKDANSKIKHLTRNIKTPTPKENIQLGI
jgi:hypothetical protein